MGGQEFSHLFVEPLIGFILLAARTMPIAAATGNGLYGATVTTINNGSEGTAAAISDMFKGFFMDLRHSLCIKRQILGPIYLENFLNRIHDNTPCITWATLTWESVWAWVVTCR